MIRADLLRRPSRSAAAAPALAPIPAARSWDPAARWRGRRQHRREGTLDEGSGRLVAAVEENGADDRFADVGQDRDVAALARLGFAGPEPQVGTDVPGRGDLGAALAAHQFRQAPRQFALGAPGKVGIKHLGDGEPEHPVAEELEALVAPRGRAVGALTWVSAVVEEACVPEPVAEPLLERRRGSSCAAPRTYRIGSKHAAPAHRRPGHSQSLPERCVLVDREEDDLGPADEVLERHLADAGLVAGIRRVVAVVAHHEEMAGRTV